MQSSRSRVTLKDIAQKAKVHVSTVSLALGNSAKLPEPTRKRIQDLAVQMKYIPDPALQALNAYRNVVRHKSYCSTLAFVTNWPQQNSRHWPTPWPARKHLEEFCEYGKRHASKQGYQLEEFRLDEKKISYEKASQILYHRNIAGLIIAPLPDPRNEMSLRWEQFAAVAIGHTLVSPRLHRVANYHYESVLLAVNNIRRLGYERFGMAMHLGMDARVNHHWISGFSLAQESIPAEHRIPPSVIRNFSLKTFEKWFMKFRPEVVMGYEDLLGYFDAMKINVPHEVGFVHLNNRAYHQYAGINQNMDLQMSTAVDFVIGMLRRNERGVPAHAVNLFVNGKWEEGYTLIPAAKRKEGKVALPIAPKVSGNDPCS